MTDPDIDPGALPPDWTDIRGEEMAQRALVELQRERPVGHRLSDAGPQAVAVRQNRKDLIFWLSVDQRWALVHFTGKAESDPTWPWTETFACWPDLVMRLPVPGKVV